jgi:DNA polymerase-3 subunit epsilon
MLDWLKNINKEHPEFWKNYVSKFDKKSTRFVVLSTETWNECRKRRDFIHWFFVMITVLSLVIVSKQLLQYKFPPWTINDFW